MRPTTALPLFDQNSIIGERLKGQHIQHLTISKKIFYSVLVKNQTPRLNQKKLYAPRIFNLFNWSFRHIPVFAYGAQDSAFCPLAAFVCPSIAFTNPVTAVPASANDRFILILLPLYQPANSRAVCTGMKRRSG